MMEVAVLRSISRKPPVAMSCWYGRDPRRMQVSLWRKLLSSAQPATRGCWRQILLETTLPILRTARLSAIRRMQKISARRFRGKDPRKSRPLNCLDLHHLSLSQELCQQARNGLGGGLSCASPAAASQCSAFTGLADLPCARFSHLIKAHRGGSRTHQYY